VCVCVCMCVCMRACARVHACVRVCVWAQDKTNKRERERSNLKK